MNLTEPLFRGAGIALALLLLLVSALRGGWRPRRDLLPVLTCVLAYLVCSSPTRHCVSSATLLPVLLAALVFPFAFWRLASVVLEDDRHVPWAAWVAAVVMLASGMVAAADYLQAPPPWRTVSGGLHKLAVIGFLGGTGLRAWRRREGDLIDARRRLRWGVICALGLYSLAVTLVEIHLQRAAAPPWLDVLNVVLIDLALLACAAFLLGVRAQAQDALLGPVTTLATAPARPGDAPSLPALVPDGDAALTEQLGALMQEQRLYRDPELSVHRLASTLEVPQYVLRRLILVRLGYRHFASFVNDYRLREITARLADPSLARRPILTLALEAGFGSIGPFNRLFRERHGMTPSEFRERFGRGV